VASAAIANVLFGIGDWGKALFESTGFIPWWITGFVWDGIYLGLAWVVSVMLPPMAIFFPAFTILEDLGYLPRVAFNLDWMFKKAGAHGKQSLTMAMGFGCNAAGVIATRVIDSPRERLIAILTNNFVPCNGRFPTLIMLATVFVAAGFSGIMSSFIAAGTVVGVVLIGVAFTFLMSWILSRTLLKGEASAFTLELPPYRRPNISRILYTSIIDRTIFVLWRAMQTAAPAGAIIWILANIHVADSNLAHLISDWLNPFGLLLGLDGVILLAYIIAIPANEIVVPTMMMVYMGAGMMVNGPGTSAGIFDLLVNGNGWTILTAVNLMLFALLHNPCATTIMTIYKETKSLKWATVSVVITLGTAFIVTFLTATLARLMGWV
jgi:ferrous iron transport protein B